MYLKLPMLESNCSHSPFTIGMKNFEFGFEAKPETGKNIGTGMS